MAVEVLLVRVGLVTSFVAALVRPLIVVGTEVGEESCGTVELFGTARHGAGDGFLFRGEFPTRGRGNVSYDGRGGLRICVRLQCARIVTAVQEGGAVVGCKMG